MNFTFWNFIFGGDDTAAIHTVDTPMTVVNPSTGLPMENDMGGVDVGGSPYGTDIHHTCMDSFNSMDSNPWD